MPKKRAILCGYYGMGNAGDEALLVCLLQALPSHIEPVVLSKTPAETRDRYGVQTCDRWDLVAVMGEMRRSSYFIWGGGSLMQDSSSRVSPLYYGGLMKLAQIFGLKTVAWAQGIGPLHHRSNRWLTRHVLKRCCLVTVRDTASYDLVQGWNIPVTIAPDPVWAMKAEGKIDLSHLPLRYGSMADRIAVNLREHSSLTPDRLAIITDALIRFQDHTHYNIILLPFQESLDLKLAQDLQAKIPNSTIQFIESPQVLKGLFSQMDLTIAMRLHGVIMAASEGCDCFALSYDPKVTSVRQSADLAGIEMTDLDCFATHEDAVRSLFIEWRQWLCLRDTGSSKARRIEESRRKLIQGARQHQDLLQQVLEAKS
jgi:polysaccharide pyruvyl transferase CsaB